MNDEDAFQAALDASPDDSTTRLVFADWLQERGDPRSEGYRALGWLRLRPSFSDRMYYWFNTPMCLRRASRELQPARLGAHWHRLTCEVIRRKMSHFDSRRKAEDAAALAFRKLPKKRRTQLLSAT